MLYVDIIMSYVNILKLHVDTIYLTCMRKSNAISFSKLENLLRILQNVVLYTK